MNKKLLLFTSLLLFYAQTIFAQQLTTVNNLRLYEHHSSSISGPMGANGFQSGYDFVNHAYVYSFDTATFGAYTNGQDTAIDMVEHNGPYGNKQNFGFTSGVSSIWNGDIKGNGITVWMKAPSGFNYAAITDVSDISSVFNASIATPNIEEVEDTAVYLGRIRNSDLYVAVRCYNVTNKVNNDTYFDFDYKYGVLIPTDVNTVKANGGLSLYPNPATENLTVKNTLHNPVVAKILSIAGQEIRSFPLEENGTTTIDISNLSKGLYIVVCMDDDGSRYAHQFIKH